MKIFFIVILALSVSFTVYSQEKNQLAQNNGFTFGVTGIYTTPLKKFNLSTPGTLTNIGQTNYCIYSGLDFGASGYLYGLHKASDYNLELFRIDTITANCIVLGTWGYSGNLAGLSFNPVTWSNYIYITGNPSKIYTTRSSGSLLMVAQLPSSSLISAISFSNNGTLFGIDETNDVLVRINRFTGNLTTVGPLGFNVNGIDGCDIDSYTGKMYVITPSVINSQLNWVDTSTGSMTNAGMFIGTLKNLAIAGNNFINPPSPPPPPNIIYPYDTIHTTTPLMDWTDVWTASYYRLVVVTGPNTVIDTYTGQSQYQVPPGILMPNTYYYWQLKSINRGGEGNWSSYYHFTITFTGIKYIGNEISDRNCLYDNYPNPFNSMTNIKWSMKSSGNVKLVVYNSVGKKVDVLLNEKMKAGVYEMKWNASALSSGIYFYKLETEDFLQTKKMIIIR